MVLQRELSVCCLLNSAMSHKVWHLPARLLTNNEEKVDDQEKFNRRSTDRSLALDFYVEFCCKS